MYSCQYAFHSVGIVLGSFIEKAFGPRMAILGGSVISCIGLGLSYFFVRYSFWLLMLTFGVLYGFATGLLYVVASICVLRWLPKWAGVATGITSGGIGVSYFVFSPLQTGFINPSDQYPDVAPRLENPDEKYFTQSELIERVPYIFLIEGLVFGVLSVLASVFMVNPSPDNALKESPHQITISATPQSNALTPSQLLRKLNFYLLWFISLINIVNIGFIIALFKSYGLEVVKASDYFLTAVGIASGFFSLFGRVAFGVLADRVDCKFGFIIQSGTLLVFFLTLYTTAFEWPIMYFIWICGIFMCNGGYSTLYNVTVLRNFGKEHLNANYAMLSTNLIVGITLSGIISDFFLDSLGWYGMFMVLSGACFIQLICALMLRTEEITSKRYTLEIFNVLYTFSESIQ